jgi:hypothetical protein
MNKIERVHVFFGYNPTNYNLPTILTEKYKYENGRLQKFYTNVLIRIDYKKQKTHQADLINFADGSIKHLLIGDKGFILDNLKPTHIGENDEYGVIYDRNGNVEKKIHSKYFSSIISEDFLYKYNYLYSENINRDISISKFDLDGNLIWKVNYTDNRKNFFGFSPIRFDDENFIFYDTIDVDMNDLYDKAWLICISNVTGVLKWKKEIEGLLAIDFLYCKDKVIVRTKTEIHAYAVETGELLWQYGIPQAEFEAFVDKWKTKIDERFLRSDGAYKYLFTIGQNDILHLLTFQKYVQIDVHTGQVLNDFAYTEQIAKFNKKPHFESSRYPIGKVIAVSTTHVIACVKNITVFINMQTGLIDHHILGEDTSGGAITEILIPAENVLVTVETCATKRFPNTILKIFEA